MAAWPAVFFDRDGVVNELVLRDGMAVSPRDPKDFRLLPEAVEAINSLRRHDLRIFIITNQPDLSRGHMSRTALDTMLATMRAAVGLDDVAVCPHDDGDECDCRKPRPGMILRLAKTWGVDLKRSVVVGDSWRDAEAGRRAGCITILLNPHGVEELTTADFTVPSIRDVPLVVKRCLGLCPG